MPPPAGMRVTSGCTVALWRSTWWVGARSRWRWSRRGLSRASGCRRRRSRLDPYKLIIDGMLPTAWTLLTSDHAHEGVLHRLLDECGAEDVTYAMVRDYVYYRRREIPSRRASGPRLRSSRRPTALAMKRKATSVTCGSTWPAPRPSTSCSHFGYRVQAAPSTRSSSSCGQQAFLEDHVHALHALGSVPFGKIRYDNLRAAVAQVLGLTRRRMESERWTVFSWRSSITSLYCHPGTEQAIEPPCRALRLPTIRSQFGEISDAAAIPDVLPRIPGRAADGANATTGPGAAANAGSRPPGSRAINRCAPSISTRTPPSTPPRSTPSPPATGSGKACRCV